VIFASEAAAVGQVAMTPAYDPASDGASQPDLGTALQIFNTLGAGLPFDVPPLLSGEPSVDHGLDGCGTRTHNPRDGVVTVIAIADGEEAFFDSNGNGKYDAGEPFIDLGEPFVDNNDNGVWDAGEWFLDVDGSGTYTVGNLAWDGTTKIWTQTVVVYTGDPATVDNGAGLLLGTRWAATEVQACTATAPEAATAFTVIHGDAGPPVINPSSVTHYVYASDMNFNMLHSETTYGAEVMVGSITADYLGLDRYADNLGFFYRYWPCDQAGNCASQCRATGANLPCVMQPASTGFTCGPVAGVQILGGATTPDPDLDRVDWVVTTPHSVFSVNKVAVAKKRLFGRNN
jgi:hypothetical protein